MADSLGRLFSQFVKGVDIGLAVNQFEKLCGRRTSPGEVNRVRGEGRETNGGDDDREQNAGAVTSAAHPVERAFDITYVKMVPESLISPLASIRIPCQNARPKPR